MKKSILTLVSMLAGCLLCSCGSSGTTDTTSTTISSSSNTIASDNTQSDDSNGESTSEIVETTVDDKQSSDDNSAGLDIEKHYDIDPKVLNTALEDGVYIQIGDAVFELGNVTLRDFYEAGVDLYEPGTREVRDESYNSYILEQEYDDGYVFHGSIGKDVYFLFRVKTKGLPSGTKCGDLVVDDISISDGNLVMNDIVGAAWNNGTSDYSQEYINGGKAKDLYYIYSNGGVRFTGTSSEIKDDMGHLSDVITPEDKGYQAMYKKYVYPEQIPNYNAITCYFCNEKCLYLEIWAHEPR